MGINEKAWHVGFKWTIGDEDNPTGAIALDDSSDALHICEIADVATNWNVSSLSHPTLYVHSATTPATKYMAFYHNGTYGYFNVDGTNIMSATSTTLDIDVDVTLTGDLALDTEDISLIDDQDMEFGTSTDVLMRFSTADSSLHSFVIALDDTSQQIHITDKGAVATDWARTGTTHPQVCIHSNTTPQTDYLAIGNFDGTTAYIDVVGGTTLQFNIAGTGEVSLTASALSPVTSNGNALGTTSLMWADLFLADGGVINFNNSNLTITHSSDTLTITGEIVTSSDNGMRSTATLVPDSTRADYFLACGTRATELDVTMAASTSQHLDPIQMNLNIIGSAPTSSSTVNGFYQYITHDTTSMPNIRLKCSDWTVNVQEDCTDAYVAQTELIVGGTKTTSGEMIAVSGLVTLQSGARTADRVCALQAMINGSGTAGTVTGDAIVAYLVNAGTVVTTDDICKVYNQSASTTTDGLEIENDGTMTTAFKINNDGTLTSGIVYEGSMTTGIDLGDNCTTGIDIGSSTTGLYFSGTTTMGIDCADMTLSADATRTNFAIGVGDRNDELTVNLGNAASQNFDPMQMNINLTCSGGAPTSASTVNMIYQQLTHDTTDMPYLRLKGCDWTITTDKACQDAYVVQTELIVSGTKTSSGELMAMSALTTLGSGARTADRVLAFQAMITGSGTAGTVVGDCFVAYLVNAGTVITTDSICCIHNQSAATSTSALELDLDGTVTYAMDFDGTVSDGWTSGDGAVVQADEYVKIPVRVNGVTPTLYILAAETWA